METPAMGTQLSPYAPYPTTIFGAELNMLMTKLGFWKTLAVEDKTPNGYIHVYVESWLPLMRPLKRCIQPLPVLGLCPRASCPLSDFVFSHHIYPTRARLVPIPLSLSAVLARSSRFCFRLARPLRPLF
jgi:hypothetical protein